MRYVSQSQSRWSAVNSSIPECASSSFAWKLFGIVRLFFYHCLLCWLDLWAREEHNIMLVLMVGVVWCGGCVRNVNVANHYRQHYLLHFFFLRGSSCFRFPMCDIVRARENYSKCFDFFLAPSLLFQTIAHVHFIPLSLSGRVGACMCVCARAFDFFLALLSTIPQMGLMNK